MEEEPEYNNTWNSTDHMPEIFDGNIVPSFICVVCVFGLVGNGAVIWLLGFRVKRNPFTTYILHLAVADFGVLIASVFIVVDYFVAMYSSIKSFWLLVGNVWFFHSVYSTGQFLLTAISIDRCVSVHFPFWYRCHRPEKLSSVLCALIWLFSFLVQGISLGFQFIWNTPFGYYPTFCAFLLNAVVCLPLITVSTLILFVRFCFKSQQRQRGKLFRAILLTLFFFLIFAFPLNVIYLIQFNPRSSPKDRFNLRLYNVTVFCWFCASLNSFVNPLLYFLIGRRKGGLCRENLKLILQRVFTEEDEACREDPGTKLTQL